MFTAALPILFQATKDSLFDRWVGELSYPIYITHITTLAVVIPLLNTESGFLRTIIYLTAVLLVSNIGAFISLPFDRTRRSENRPPTSPELLMGVGTPTMQSLPYDPGTRTTPSSPAPV